MGLVIRCRQSLYTFDCDISSMRVIALGRVASLSHLMVVFFGCKICIQLSVVVVLYVMYRIRLSVLGMPQFDRSDRFV